MIMFRQPITEAGIQIPKGTVNTEEDTYNAIIRKIEEF